MRSLALLCLFGVLVGVTLSGKAYDSRSGWSEPLPLLQDQADTRKDSPAGSMDHKDTLSLASNHSDIHIDLPGVPGNRPYFFEGGILPLAQLPAWSGVLNQTNATETLRWMLQSYVSTRQVLTDVVSGIGASLYQQLGGMAEMPYWLWQQVASALFSSANNDSILEVSGNSPEQWIVQAARKGKGQANTAGKGKGTGNKESGGRTPSNTGSNDPPEKKKGAEATGNGDKKPPPGGNPDEDEGAVALDDEEQMFWDIFLAAIDYWEFDVLIEWMAEHRDFMETGLSEACVLRVREKLSSNNVPESIVAQFPERMRPLPHEAGATGRGTGKKNKKRQKRQKKDCG